MDILQAPIILKDFLQLGDKFCEESGWGVLMDHDKTFETLTNYVHDADSLVHIEYMNDIPVGFVILTADRSFHNPAFGYIVKFYVIPEARGKGVARDLVKLAVQWFDAQDCTASFATDTARVRQGNAFTNLFMKFGYEGYGGLLIRHKDSHGKS